MFILFFQELKDQTLYVISGSDTPVASTNLERDASKPEHSLRDWVQLKSVNVLLVSVRES